MSSRRVHMVDGSVIHILNKSISNYKIFRDPMTIYRFINIVEYYNNPNNFKSFSLLERYNKEFIPKGLFSFDSNNVVKFLAYCVMPDHYHFLIKIFKAENISNYISKIENSYSRYFNQKNNRKGPLWQSRFKSVYIKSNEQLLHVMRYIHLNPVTAYLVNKPEDWQFSSYRQLINEPDIFNKIDEISITSIGEFKKFTEDNIDHQRTLKQIKKILLE